MDKAFNFNFMMPKKGNATKTFEYKKGKWELKAGYKAGKYFKGYEVPVSSIEEAFEVLETNQEAPVFTICGAFIEGVDTDNMLRRSRTDGKDGAPPTITNRNLNLVCFDIDGYKGGTSIHDFIMLELPPEFHDADYIYQYSSSHGLTTHNTLKCHLFFWLDEPVHNLDIREWIKNYNKAKDWGNVIDPSILNAAQPIYIQRRICEGADDPVEDFYGLVKKKGNLCWKPSVIEIGDQIKPVNRKESQYDLAAGIERILTSENYHNELNSLALSLLNHKVPPKTVVSMLEGAMNAAKRMLTDEDRLKDWQVRFDDIQRSVDTAVNIVDVPTIEEVLEWIDKHHASKVEVEFAERVMNLSPIDKAVAINKLVEKLGFGINVIKKTIKIAEQERDEARRKEAQDAKSNERAQKGIQELELTIENSGDVADKVCRLLANSKKEPKVFEMGNSLVSVYVEKPKTIRQCNRLFVLGKDYPKMPIISRYAKPYSSLSDRIKMDTMLQDSAGNDIDIPSRFLNVIGECRSPHFKSLTGIVESPFIDHNWKLVAKNGYNEQTGLYTYLHHKLKIKKMDSKQAYDYLAYEVFDEFPFSSDLDRAVAVSTLMTAVQRPSICGDHGFPGYGIVSPIQSSGKTTMAQLISYSVFNRPIAATSLSDDENELNKHLLAILQEGHSCILFDNIEQGQPVTSNVLARAMSTDIFSGRQLGENKNISVPSAVLWMFTGNSIKFVGDFATRVYPININPKMEDPNVREFKRPDIGQWAMDNRKRIISAILSIIIKGKDLKLSNTGSTRFLEWDMFVRKPLLAVTGIDINEAVKNNQMSDPRKLGSSNLLSILKETFKDKKFTTKDIITQAFGSFENDTTELGEALENLLEEKAKNRQSIGRLLSGMTDAVYGSLMLTRKDSNVVYWYVKDITEDE